MAPETASTRADWIPLLPLRSPMRRTSGTSRLQSETRWSFRMPIVPPLVLSRKTSDASSFRSATSSPRLAPSTYSICKIPRLSALAPLSHPLQIFKRQYRKTSLRAVFNSPSLESFEAQVSVGTDAEALVTETETLSESFGYHAIDKDSVTSGHSSLSLVLPSPNIDEGQSTQIYLTPNAEKNLGQATEIANQAHITSHNHATNLKRPTPLQKLQHPKHSLPSATTTTRCALCQSYLRHKSSIYTFPQTAPAVIRAVRTLYPTLDLSISTPSSPLPLPSPPFCAPCFTTLRTHHLCWTCGHTIHPAELRLACGWAWWHWSCLSCLLCRAPLRPPAWTDEAGEIWLGGSPACGGCRGEVRAMGELERGRKRGMGMGLGLDGAVVEACGGGGEGEGYRAAARYPGSVTPMSMGGVSGCGTGAVATVATATATECSGRNAVGYVAASPLPNGNSNNNNNNGRMKWLMRRAVNYHGHGGVGDAGDGSAIDTGSVIKSKRIINGRLQVGETQYPPLPKWMERMPGQQKERMRRRNVSLGCRVRSTSHVRPEMGMEMEIEV